MAKDYATLLDTYRLRNEIERRAHASNIKLVFTEEGSIPSASRNAVYIPRPRNPMTVQELRKYKAHYIHESGHLGRPEIFDVLAQYEDNEKNAKLAKVINMVEDHVMERRQSLNYRGDAFDLGAGFDQTVGEIIVKLADDGVQEHLEDKDPDTANMLALQAQLVDARHEWDKIGGSKSEAIKKALPPMLAPKIELLKTKLNDRVNQDLTPDEVHTLSREIYEYVFDGADDDEVPEPEYPDGPPDGANTCEDGCESVEDGAGSEVDGEGAPCEGDDGGPTSGHVKIHWSDIGSNDAHGAQESASSTIDYDGYDWHATWQPYPQDHIVVPSLTYRKPPASWLDEDGSNKQFANHVRRLIQSRMKSKFRSEKETGKIHSRNLYRVAVPPVGDGQWNRQIFKKREEAPEINTAITVLVDWSGSMSGHKMQLANLAAQRLNDVFSTALSVPTEVLSFSDRAGKPHFAVIKGFKERRCTGNDIAGRFQAFRKYTSGNSDADAVLWAADRLVSRGEPRKILIVLSDGCPTDGWKGNAAAGLSQVCKELQARRDLELYGIGIEDKNVKLYYGDNAFTVNHADELNHVLIQTLEDSILKKLNKR